MDDWKKLNETTLLVKEEFYSSLNVKKSTDIHYMKEFLKILK